MLNGRHHTLYWSERAFHLDFREDPAPAIKPLLVEHLWEAGKDAFAEQVPGATGLDLKQVMFIHGTRFHIWSLLGEVRTQAPAAFCLESGYEFDTCFPDLAMPKWQYDDALLLTTVTPEVLDHHTRDLDAPAGSWLPMLYSAVRDQRHATYRALEERGVILPQFYGDSSVMTEAHARDLTWVRDLDLEVPDGLRGAYVKSMQNGRVLLGDMPPGAVGNLEGYWLDAINLSDSMHWGGLTAVYLTGFTVALLVSQSKDGSSLVVTQWHRELSFEQMVQFHEVLERTFDLALDARRGPR